MVRTLKDKNGKKTESKCFIVLQELSDGKKTKKHNSAYSIAFYKGHIKYFNFLTELSLST